MTIYKSHLALITMTAVLLGGCSSTFRKAPVIDRPVQSAKIPAKPRQAEPAPQRQDAKGTYTVALSTAADAPVETRDVSLNEQAFGR